MIPKPLNEAQVLNRLSYYASSGVSADALPIANACRWLTFGPEDQTVTAHWSEILQRFIPLFKATHPMGLCIPAPTPGNPVTIHDYRPAMIKALRLWVEAKTEVLGAPMKTEARPIALPSQIPSPSTSRRLIGGSLGELIETDADESPASAAQPSAGDKFTPPASQPRSELTAPAFFPEVTVRPAKVTRQQSAEAPLIESTALESAERETTEVDSLLAVMLGSNAFTAQSTKNTSR